MFPALDVQAWRESAHNPLRMLAMLPEETLQAAARNTDFLERYDAVMDEFDAEVGTQTGWFTSEHGKSNPPMAIRMTNSWRPHLLVSAQSCYKAVFDTVFSVYSLSCEA